MDGGDADDELDPARDADRWLAEQLVDDAARSRRRTANLREQAAQEGTLRGVLVDLAERGRPVVLRTVTGTEHRLALTLVGRDVVAGRTMRGEHATAGLDAVASVRTEPGITASIGDRQVDTSTTLVGHLHELASIRPDVVVTLRDGARLSGTLTTVGADVLTIRLRDGDHSTIHLARHALVDLVVLDASELS